MSDTKLNNAPVNNIDTVHIPKAKRTFTGWYWQGNLPPLSKVFEFDGTLTQAAIRFSEHCRKMGYKWGRVRPHIVDLDKQEELKFKDPDWTEEMDSVEAVKEAQRR